VASLLCLKTLDAFFSPSTNYHRSLATSLKVIKSLFHKLLMTMMGEERWKQDEDHKPVQQQQMICFALLCVCLLLFSAASKDERN
jgi:hypothetical protein